MSVIAENRLNLFLLENMLWLLTKPVHNSNYDFPFEQLFTCQHKWQLPDSLIAVARMGAIDQYSAFYKRLQQDGMALIHTPDEHRLASELPYWYPKLADLTPKSVWFSELPTLKQITAHFDFPVFIKGARQTSKHQKNLSIIESSDDFEKVMAQYADDPILHWQKVVCREYVPLRPVAGGSETAIPASFEFRTFWWKGQCVGAGRYWYEAETYDWSTKERKVALSIAQEVADRLKVPFLAVDMAQQADDKWIVIECNDGQESGYAGISPIALWKNIISIEQES